MKPCPVGNDETQCPVCLRKDHVIESLKASLDLAYKRIQDQAKELMELRDTQTLRRVRE